MANFARGTIQVIGNDFHDHRYAARRISFVSDFLIIRAIAFANGLFDGAHDVIIGHIGSLRLGNNILQLAVQVRIAAAAGLDGDYDFTADLRKDFALCRIGLCLFVLNG